MKRQVAITGPTPEFLRWSIRQTCPLRDDTDLASVDETEKRLRAIRTAGNARRSGHVHDGIACQRIDGQWKAFRMDEVFALWGGEDQATKLCHDCPANVQEAGQTLAGCHGWLTPTGDQPWSRRIEEVITDDLRQHIQQNFLPTQPVWYGLWADGELKSRQLQIVQEVLEQWASYSAVQYDEVTTLCHAVAVCLQHRLPLDVQLLPAGHSDGVNWIIQPHCDRCRAPFRPIQTGCQVCGKAGQGHPPIKRRVLGLRPWVDMQRVIGEANVESFLRRHYLEPSSDST